MTNEMEKLTVNLGIVDLAQIDVLVEQGIYSNRSDFIRTAIRKQLEVHQEKIERSLTPITGTEGGAGVSTVGIHYVSKEDLEEAFRDNGEKKIKISVIGMLVVSCDVSAELFTKTVARVIVRGKLVASSEIMKLIEKTNKH